MKPTLYSPHEQKFASNGIGILSDATHCVVTEELNGQCELMLQYPMTGIHATDIDDRCIVMAPPAPGAKPQPFRIYRIFPSSKGTIAVHAQHIVYDLKGIPAAPFTASSAADAMLQLKTNAVAACAYTFATDKDTAAKMVSITPKSIWQLLGGTAGSVLDVYGGEYEFDRFAVVLHHQRGADRGVTIRYGKNLKTLEQDRNCSNCYTGVYPYWASMEGDLVQLPELTLPAPGHYNYTKIYTLDLSAEWLEPPTEEQLRNRAIRYMSDNNIGVPAVSWKVEYVALEQTTEYKGRAILDRVLLGDTVHVYFPEMHVNASARAVKTQYNVLLDRYDHVQLGKVKSNLADVIVQQQQQIDKKTDTSAAKQISEALTAAILGAKGGAVRLLDTDGDGMPDTLYIADNPDPSMAVKVWRWNYEGWAGSVNGYNGPFIMGATLEEGILANAVTAANLIAGTIKSADDGNTFFLDLNSGVFRMHGSGQFRSEDGESYITVDGNTFILYSKNQKTGTFLPKFRLGFNSDSSGVDYPWILIGNTDEGRMGLIKKFTNGLWVGNSVPLNAVGAFAPSAGAAGFFVDTESGTPYTVADGVMRDVSVAVFG